MTKDTITKKVNFVILREYILFKFSWLTNDTIAATWTNRLQNIAQIFSYDIHGKESYVVYLKESEGWVIPSELFCYNGYLICLANQDSGTPAGKFRYTTKFDLKRDSDSLKVDLTPGAFENPTCHSCHYKSLEGILFGLM